MNNGPIHRATDFLQSVLKEKIHKGNVVVDATMGNGNDTFFLWEQVRSKGMIYAFDIQEESIKNTIKRFREKDVPMNSNNIRLIHDGHQNMLKYIKEAI